MVVKIYISGISGNKEVKKRQQRVLMILDSKNIKYDVIDITEPGKEADKDFMQNNAKSNGGTVSDPNPRSPLPPQLFNDDEYCGDYDQFDLANEVDTLEQFLKVEPPQELPQGESEKDTVVNGDAEKDDIQEQKDYSQEKESGDADKPEETKESSDAKEKIPSRETTPSDRKTSKEPSPAKDAIQETETEKEPVKETSPERQKSDVDDATSVPLKEKSPSPAKQDDEVKHSKEPSPAKEDDTGTKLSKESTPIKDDETESKQSKETTPEEESVNENGTASSREQSEEKVIESKKDNPSESLIASEQTAAAE